MSHVSLTTRRSLPTFCDGSTRQACVRISQKQTSKRRNWSSRCFRVCTRTLVQGLTSKPSECIVLLWFEQQARSAHCFRVCLTSAKHVVRVWAACALSALLYKRAKRVVRVWAASALSALLSCLCDKRAKRAVELGFVYKRAERVIVLGFEHKRAERVVELGFEQ